MPSSSPLSFDIRKQSRATVDYLALQSNSTSPNAVVPLIQSSPSDTGTSLLDKYEIKRISQELNHYIEISQAGHKRVVSFPGNSTASERKSHEHRIKRTNRWFRHGMMCSSRYDTVLKSTALPSPLLPNKHAPFEEKHISFVGIGKRSGMFGRK